MSCRLCKLEYNLSWTVLISVFTKILKPKHTRTAWLMYPKILDKVVYSSMNLKYPDIEQLECSPRVIKTDLFLQTPVNFTGVPEHVQQ